MGTGTRRPPFLYSSVHQFNRSGPCPCRVNELDPMPPTVILQQLLVATYRLQLPVLALVAVGVDLDPEVLADLLGEDVQLVGEAGLSLWGVCRPYLGQPAHWRCLAMPRAAEVDRH